jgi:periplasmic divalent cation tolerance protein
MILIFTSYPDENLAQDLAQKLIEKKLAACCWLEPKHKSIYQWQNKIHTEFEYKVIIKTKADRYCEIEAFIRAHHPFEVPAIFSIEAKDIDKNYKSWLQESVT